VFLAYKYAADQMIKQGQGGRIIGMQLEPLLNNSELIIRTQVPRPRPEREVRWYTYRDQGDANAR
jgi:hypothetical protein